LQIAEMARHKFKALGIEHLLLGLRYKLGDVYTVNLTPAKINRTGLSNSLRPHAANMPAPVSAAPQGLQSADFRL
jgi:hypothetical protein